MALVLSLSLASGILLIYLSVTSGRSEPEDAARPESPTERIEEFIRRAGLGISATDFLLLSVGQGHKETSRSQPDDFAGTGNHVCDLEKSNVTGADLAVAPGPEYATGLPTGECESGEVPVDAGTVAGDAVAGGKRIDYEDQRHAPLDVVPGHDSGAGFELGGGQWWGSVRVVVMGWESGSLVHELDGTDVVVAVEIRGRRNVSVTVLNGATVVPHGDRGGRGR